jgi:hypothetical protein
MHVAPDHDPIGLNRTMISSLVWAWSPRKRVFAFVARENRYAPRYPSAGQTFSGSCFSSRRNGHHVWLESTFPPTAIAAADRTLGAKISFERPGRYESVVERFNAVATGLRKIANDAAITIGGGQGQFALNVDEPRLAYCMMHSIQLLADVARSFTEHCVDGICADEKRIGDLMQRSLMLVAALAPKIGHDNAAKVAKSGHARGTTLREEAVRLGFVSAAEFDRLVQPDKMTRHGWTRRRPQSRRSTGDMIIDHIT